MKLVAINPNHAESVRLDELAWSDLSDSFDEIKERAKQEKFNFVWLDDGAKQELGHKMGPVATPHVFIFDKSRKLRFEGRIDDSERESLATSHDTRDALDALLAGKEPPVTSTRVFGCSVKWADKVVEYAKYKERWAAEPVTLEKADVADAAGDPRQQGFRQAALHQRVGDLVRALRRGIRRAGRAQPAFPHPPVRDGDHLRGLARRRGHGEGFPHQEARLDEELHHPGREEG